MLSPASPDVTVPSRNIVPDTVRTCYASASFGATHAEAVATRYTSAADTAGRAGVATLRIILEGIGIEVAHRSSREEVCDGLCGRVSRSNWRCDHGQRKESDERRGELQSGECL